MEQVDMMTLREALRAQRLEITRDEYKRAFIRETKKVAKLKAELLYARITLKKRQGVKRKAPVLKLVA